MKLRSLAMLAIAAFVAGLALQMAPAQSATPSQQQITPGNYASFLGGSTARFASQDACTSPTAC